MSTVFLPFGAISAHDNHEASASQAVQTSRRIEASAADLFVLAFTDHLARQPR